MVCLHWFARFWERYFAWQQLVSEQRHPVTKEETHFPVLTSQESLVQVTPSLQGTEVLEQETDPSSATTHFAVSQPFLGTQVSWQVVSGGGGQLLLTVPGTGTIWQA
jgi:hypothetical protein